MRFTILILFLLSLLEFSWESGVFVERISPMGFRIKSDYDSMDNLIKIAVFNVNIERSLVPQERTDYTATILDSSAGHFIYDNINTYVQGGWTVYYRIDFFYDSESYLNLTIKPIKQISKRGQFTYYTIDITPENEEKCSKLFRPSKLCELSETTVRGESVCQGELILEDHFKTLNPSVWKIDARIPWDLDDSPFVSFQDDTEVVYIRDGLLHIKPKFLWNTSGFNESMIKTGTLKIEGCSGIGQECTKKAKFSQILPPIISARIRTKHFFSFRYGKIVIGASMPKGDWTMPTASVLYLEPMENYYGPSNYASGQIRIASLRGNQVLQTYEGKDISSRYLSGGVVLEDGETLHESSMRHYNSDEHLSNEFHNFTLTWTEKAITVGIDDHEYGTIEGGFSKLFSYKNANAWVDSDSTMAPFDREFYITIGLSVGGHTAFPNLCKSGDEENRVTKPWKNNDPKAMLNFWNHRADWMKSWKKFDTKFRIDFILVYAL